MSPMEASTVALQKRANENTERHLYPDNTSEELEGTTALKTSLFAQYHCNSACF